MIPLTKSIRRGSLLFIRDDASCRLTERRAPSIAAQRAVERQSRASRRPMIKHADSPAAPGFRLRCTSCRTLPAAGGGSLRAAGRGLDSACWARRRNGRACRVPRGHARAGRRILRVKLSRDTKARRIVQDGIERRGREIADGHRDIRLHRVSERHCSCDQGLSGDQGLCLRSQSTSGLLSNECTRAAPPRRHHAAKYQGPRRCRE